MKNRLAILVTCATLLTSCSTVTYQELVGHVPDGYSQIQLDDDHFRITYETYKETTENLLSEMAKFRAAELTLANDKAYFEILSSDFMAETIKLKIPEQRIASFVMYSESGLNGRSRGNPAEVSSTIPAYFRPHQIKKEKMEIRIYDTKVNDRLVAAQKIIDEQNFNW